MKRGAICCGLAAVAVVLAVIFAGGVPVARAATPPVAAPPLPRRAPTAYCQYFFNDDVDVRAAHCMLTS